MATSVEDKDFAWLCSALANFNLALRVPETIFLYKDQVTLWTYTNQAGVVQKRSATEEGLVSSQDALDYFIVKRRKENSSSSEICVAGVKGNRVMIDDDKIEEIAQLRGPLTRCSFLQIPLEDSSFYLITLSREDSGRFSSNFQLRRKTLQPAKDLRLYYKLLVEAKLVIRVLETHKRKKVLDLELEFGVQDSGEVFLCGCNVCKLETVPTGKVPIPKAIDQTKPKRGSKSMNFRISTPQHLLESEASIKDPDRPEIAISPLETMGNQEFKNPVPPGQKQGQNLPQIASPPVSVKGAKTTTNPVHFYNANFREILARSYAKAQNVLVDDIDQIFNDLDRNYLKEEEQPQRLKHFGSIALRREENAISMFEAMSPVQSKKTETFTSETEITPIPQFSQSPTFSASQHQGLTISTVKRRRLKPVASSMGVSSLQKLMDKYQVNKRLDFLSARRSEMRMQRGGSMPVTEGVKTYHFKLVKQ